ncbi:MAG: ribosome biogenesis GTPase Der [Nitrospinota bacterium]|nr:ribosome biogenesis GTPase Der [Nitrospinota bacterium]
MPIPQVAIIGRANVGKSTLFNKIIKKRAAIVNDTPGVTRDRMFGRAEWFGKTFIVIDTGGIDLSADNDIELQVKDQADIAIAQADAILFVGDGQQGLTPQDQEVISKVRASGKTLFVLVNKADDPKHEIMTGEFFKMGVAKTFAISAEHSLGIEGMLEELVRDFPLPDKEPEEKRKGIRLAIIGKPNAGKSSLVNKLLRTDRCIVSEIPGTTRDTLDTSIVIDDTEFILMDTAGIRRKGKTTGLLEKYSVIMALKALERCDIAVLVLDGKTGVSEQDATIAGYAYEQGRGCILAVNKCDLLEHKQKVHEAVEVMVKEKLKFLDFAPVLFISAKTGFGLKQFFPTVEQVYKEFTRRVPTGKLNDCFAQAIAKNPFTSFRGKFIKLFYATQVKNSPPTIQCFVNYPEGIHFSYRRYLINSLRKTFGFTGTPLRLKFSPRRPDS